MQQLSALVSQREALAFSEEELEAALCQLGSSSSENFITCGEHTIILLYKCMVSLCKKKSIYPIIHLLHQNTSLKVANTQAATGKDWCAWSILTLLAQIRQRAASKGRYRSLRKWSYRLSMESGQRAPFFSHLARRK